jgi:hypothetical protein
MKRDIRYGTHLMAEWQKLKNKDEHWALAQTETGLQAQPYWHARVIGNFHGLVSSSHAEVKDRSPRLVNFLHLGTMVWCGS